ncbi:hypothetical protein MATL_G00001720 [Megalops atlanticus]|uniref:Uncharacterized protein n=1 Tax=Megalops atlanticus TaxID=7932 RepID=A0A9D3QFG1_MEGAT|nr:hypothetical protein MATL_G00001720 [Megalops atlanticus]
MAAKCSGEEDPAVCPACDDLVSELRALWCGHSLCDVCLTRYREQKDALHCPFCWSKYTGEPRPNLAMKEQTLQKLNLELLCNRHLMQFNRYCTDDEQLVCGSCLMDREHSGHDFWAIGKAASQRKREVSVEHEGVPDRLPALPSIFSGRGSSNSGRRRRTPTGKKRIAIKDIVCLPKDTSSTNGRWKVPRGRDREKLSLQGLIGKIHINSAWSPEQVRAEISSLFKDAFGQTDQMEFKFLQCLPGARCLMIPRTSSTFVWNGSEVLSLCGQGALYILSESDLREVEIVLSDDSSAELSPPRTRRRVEAPSNEDSHHSRQKDCVVIAIDPQEVEADQRSGNSSNQFADFVSIPSDEEDEIQEAVLESLHSDDSQIPAFIRPEDSLSPEEISGILTAHSEKVVVPPARRVFISRKAVWDTAIEQFRRRTFTNKQGLINVTFTCDEREEDAIDDGGPRREFFRLLGKAIFEDSGGFQETRNGFVPRLNIALVSNGTFRVIGQMISTILVQGGQPPSFLAPGIVDYFLTGNMTQTQVTYDDIPEVDIRESLSKIEKSNSEAELEEALDGCDWRFSIEGLPSSVTLANKSGFVRCATVYWAIMYRKSCLDELAQGMSHYEIIDLLRRHQGMRVLLDFQRTSIDADTVAGLFRPSYSVIGSNRRIKEELMVVRFKDFLLSIENRELLERLEEHKDLTAKQKEFISILTPAKQQFKDL